MSHKVGVPEFCVLPGYVVDPGSRPGCAKWVSRTPCRSSCATVSQQGASAAAISESVGGETLGWSRIAGHSGSYSVLAPQVGPAGGDGFDRCPGSDAIWRSYNPTLSPWGVIGRDRRVDRDCASGYCGAEYCRKGGSVPGLALHER